MGYYPPVGFHFRVTFELPQATRLDVDFREVSGLSAEMEQYEVKEGGENKFTHRLPLRAKYTNLILKRGMLLDSGLIDWFTNAIEYMDIQPISVTVALLNRDHQPLQAWNFIQAYPVKWSISDFNAQANEIVVESIELSYQYFQRVKKVQPAKPAPEAKN